MYAILIEVVLFCYIILIPVFHTDAPCDLQEFPIYLYAKVGENLSGVLGYGIKIIGCQRQNCRARARQTDAEQSWVADGRNVRRDFVKARYLPKRK